MWELDKKFGSYITKHLFNIKKAGEKVDFSPAFSIFVIFLLYLHDTFFRPIRR